MYRGMIEGAEWAKEGTYLRQKIKQYQLDKVTGHGRIWRLTYDGIARDRTRPRMLTETPAQLVAHLSHPNGWWRDTAQQLLVLQQDRSVVPALRSLVRSSRTWSRASMRCGRSRGWVLLTRRRPASCCAIPSRACASRPCAPARRCTRLEIRSFATDYRSLSKDDNIDVVIQALLTINVLKVPDATVRGQGGGRHEHGARRAVRREQNHQSARGVRPVGATGLRSVPSSRAAWIAAVRFTPSCASHATARTGAAHRRPELPRGRRWLRRLPVRPASTAIVTM